MQKKLRFAATSPGVGGSSPNLGPRQPEVATTEGSAAPNPSDHRADAGSPASDEQGHDAGLTGVETQDAARAEQPRAQPSTQEAVVRSPPRSAPVPETATPTPSTPAAPTPVVSETPTPAPRPTHAPAPSAATKDLQRSPSAKASAPAQGTSSSQQSPAATLVLKRPATASASPPQQVKKSKAAPAATDAGASTRSEMVLHAAQAAISAAEERRLGTVRARAPSGESLGSLETEWVKPWNEADVDMDVSHVDPLGGIHLGQKTTRIQNALNELFSSWTDQQKTTKVSFFPA